MIFLKSQSLEHKYKEYNYIWTLFLCNSTPDCHLTFCVNIQYEHLTLKCTYCLSDKHCRSANWQQFSLKTTKATWPHGHIEHQELKELAHRKRFEGDRWLGKTFFIIQLLFVRSPAVKRLKWQSLETNHLH